MKNKLGIKFDEGEGDVKDGRTGAFLVVVAITQRVPSVNILWTILPINVCHVRCDDDGIAIAPSNS